MPRFQTDPVIWGRASQGSLSTWFGAQVLFCTALFRQVCLGLPAHRLAPKPVKRKPFHGLPTRRQAPKQVKKQPYTGAQTALSQPLAIPPATRNVRQGETKQSHLDMPWETRGNKGRQSKIISAQHPSIQTPWETRGSKERQSQTKQNHLSPASRHAVGDKGREGETNHLSPASRHAMKDKGRQGETKQSDPTPASRHAMGDKGR